MNQKPNLLLCGAGAVASNLAGILVADTRGEYEITVLDFDTVQERNIRASTQFYLPEQIGVSKAEALQYNIYKFFGRNIAFLNEKLVDKNAVEIISQFDLVVDAFDNATSRALVTETCVKLGKDCVHVGFGDTLTFSIEWNCNGYEPPTQDPQSDICDMEGAGSFVRLVASVSSLVIQRALTKKEYLDVVGNSLSVRIVA